MLAILACFVCFCIGVFVGYCAADFLYGLSDDEEW